MDKTIEKIERLNLVFLAVGAVAGWGLSVVHLPSFLLGGSVMHANFWLLKRVVRAILATPQDNVRSRARAALWLSVKGVMFFLLLGALLWRYPVHGGSFACGVSLLLLACVIVSLPGLQTDPGKGGVGE